MTRVEAESGGFPAKELDRGCLCLGRWSPKGRGNWPPVAFPERPQDLGQLDGRIVPSAGTRRLRAKRDLPLWKGTKPAFVKHDSTSGSAAGDGDSLQWHHVEIAIKVERLKVFGVPRVDEARKQFQLRALPGWQRHGKQKAQQSSDQ